MPTTTEPFADIRREQRVIHFKYGRGTVANVNHAAQQAGVRFDDDTKLVLDPPPRTVWLKHLTPEPVNMPAGIADPQAFVRAPYRVVWPLDRARGGVS